MKRYTEEKMLKIFAQWRESGLSAAAFAQKRGISIKTFYYWSRKFKRQTSEAATGGFQALTVTESPSSNRKSSGVLLHYPSGVIVELQGEIDVALLRSLTR